MRVNGENQSILVNSEGAIVGHEEKVTFEALPAAIRNTLPQQAGRAPLKPVEAVVRNGKTVAYEAVVLREGPAGKTEAREAVVLADGHLSEVRSITRSEARAEDTE